MPTSQTLYPTELNFDTVPCAGGRREFLSAPPGIEIVFFGILAGCFISATAVAYGIGYFLSRLFKVKVAVRGIIIVAALFIIFFSAASIVPRQREDNQTIYFLGNPTPYQGAWIYYGVPSIWYRMFEPYDATQKNLFTLPSFTNFVDLFIDLAFWMAISVSLVFCGKFLTTRKRAPAQINITIA